MAIEWDVEVGAHLSRDERRRRYGGSTQGGIEPSAKTPNVFVYSDPSRGEAYGYTYDGWDTERDVFLYTGEGRVGDQMMTAGNAAILHHRDDGRALRVFVADGYVADSRAKNHRYVGEFTIDATVPYIAEEAPDVNGDLRKVYVFRLRPIDSGPPADQDLSPAGDACETSTAELIPPESHAAAEFDRGGTDATTARRRESDLVKRYEAYLADQGHQTARYRLRAPRQLQWMYTDTVDVTTNELTEAKGTTIRTAVRQAIGQLFDYRRHAYPPPQTLAILLPSEPPADLIDLAHGLGIACIYETTDGHFNRIPPSAGNESFPSTDMP